MSEISKKLSKKTILIIVAVIAVVAIIISAHLLFTKNEEVAFSIGTEGGVQKENQAVVKVVEGISTMIKGEFSERAKIIAKEKDQEKVIDSDKSVIEEFNFIFDEEPKQ